MKKDSNFVKSAIRYRKLIYFLVAVMVAFGIYSLLTINKDEFPTFQIKDGLVVGVYPGANAQEVEEQLTGLWKRFCSSLRKSSVRPIPTLRTASATFSSSCSALPERKMKYGQRLSSNLMHQGYFCHPEFLQFR